jgi:acyl carrier protein
MIDKATLVANLKASGFDLIADDIDANAGLTEQGLDSLEVALLIFRVEKIYKLKIPMQEAARIQTLMDLLEYVNKVREAEESEKL